MNNLSLIDLASYLDSQLLSASIPGDQNGIYRPSKRVVRRIGLALEPWRGIDVWTEQKNLDALFLHRPWQLDTRTLLPDLGILAYHLAFDLALTLGYNSHLADVLQMTHLIPFAYKNSLPLGMLGNISPLTVSTLIETLTEVFGKRPVVEKSTNAIVNRIAVVGAMTDALIREAAAQGVRLYITGQFRQPARQAVEETEMIVAVIGHRTSELWGLRMLANLLLERWPLLDVVIAEE